MEKIRVLFNGVYDRRPGHDKALLIRKFISFDRGTCEGFTAYLGREIEGGISRKEFDLLCADYPNAFEIITEDNDPKKDEAPEPAPKKRSPGRPKGSKNKKKNKRRKKKAPPKK